MRQRKAFVRRPRIEEKYLQERAFFNLEGRSWLERQIALLGRGHNLKRKMTLRTPNVKRKAHDLSHGKDALTAVKSIVHFASNIPFVETSTMTAIKFYGKQTADDIVSGKSIPTFKGATHGLLGCQTFCATAIALMRAATPKSGQITKVRAIRTINPAGRAKDGKLVGMPHTIISFQINGKTYLADPFKQGYGFIKSKQVGGKGLVIEAEKARKLVEELKKQGNWNEALDPSEHKINTFEEYVNEAREYGGEIAKKMDLERFIREMK